MLNMDFRVNVPNSRFAPDPVLSNLSVGPRIQRRGGGSFHGDKMHYVRICGECGGPMVYKSKMNFWKCPPCESRHAVQWARDNRKAKRASNKRYARGNPKIISAKTRRYREKYPEKYTAKNMVQSALRNGSLKSKH